MKCDCRDGQHWTWTVPMRNTTAAGSVVVIYVGVPRLSWLQRFRRMVLRQWN